MARQPDHSLLVDCLLNKQAWPEPLQLITEAVQRWHSPDEFMAQR
ncbi:hypothetical protein [Hymenobacter swuensis]|uniref:Uncharacterized protein n=1 Tax=Hymenobacter swuensis DY53 TaxID=1227739 RepID=W8FA36_9BACT|nr:hypothetical protein [Hymenobacter swuensis]AHJ98565.1 hypothetical protein Hsw_2970 [Hymenobacter swuensis DY53]